MAEKSYTSVEEVRSMRISFHEAEKRRNKRSLILRLILTFCLLCVFFQAIKMAQDLTSLKVSVSLIEEALTVR